MATSHGADTCAPSSAAARRGDRLAQPRLEGCCCCRCSISLGVLVVLLADIIIKAFPVFAERGSTS